MMIFKCMAESIGAESLWAPGTNVSDGIAFHYAQKNNMIRVEHDFEADVLSAARNLSERYMSYTPHIDALTQRHPPYFDTAGGTPDAQHYITNKMLSRHEKMLKSM